MMVQLDWQGHPITVELSNGSVMWNATHMAKAFGKVPKDFLLLKQTKSFIKVLSKTLDNNASERWGNPPIGQNNAYRVIKGGTPELQGTWMHRKLALKFAAWLSPEFELWVYDHIEQLLFTDPKKFQQPKREVNRVDYEQIRAELFHHFTCLTKDQRGIIGFVIDRYLAADKKSDKTRAARAYFDLELERSFPYAPDFVIDAFGRLRAAAQDGYLGYHYSNLAQ